MIITETQRVSRLIANHGGMTEQQFFAEEIRAWLAGKRRKEQLTGQAYYDGDHDIRRRQRTVIGEDGKLQPVDNLPNNRIVDNQYALMVDQKTNYLVGKPITVSGQNEAYVQRLQKVFDRQFGRVLKYVGEDALKGGIGWLYLHYGDGGELAFRHFSGHEILPFWADDAHTVLDCAVRLYPQEVWEGTQKKTIQRVELYKTDGIWRYVYDNGTLTPDRDLGDHENYFSVQEGEEVTELNWEKIPLIPFKANKGEIPLIRRVKSIQDGINRLLSDWQNNMEEDARNTILVLSEYDGQDLGEFRRNLAQYGAVKIRADGGVSTLTVEVNAENYDKILATFKKKLIENARGFDAKDDRLGSNPNQMNISSMYSDIDLDANGMETEFQAAIEELLWFVTQHLSNTGAGDFDGETVTIVFNRDLPMNESEAIDNCSKSVGIISNETIVAQHPWTADPQQELERLRLEKEEALERSLSYAGAFHDPSGEGAE